MEKKPKRRIGGKEIRFWFEWGGGGKGGGGVKLIRLKKGYLKSKNKSNFYFLAQQSLEYYNLNKKFLLIHE